MSCTEDKVDVLTTGTEFYSKVLKPTLEEELKDYLSNRFNLTPIIDYSEKIGFGTIVMEDNEGDGFLFFVFWFLDNDYKFCRIDKEDASFVSFKLQNSFDSLKKLSKEVYITIGLPSREYHFLYSFYDCPCAFHIDYFKKHFVKELGLNKDYNKYLEELYGEEVF